MLNKRRGQMTTCTPLRILTLIFTGPDNPAILVLEPIEEPKDGISRIVPIWIGGNESMQIAVAIEHAKFPRPMTHDLFLDAITNLDAFIDHVLIDQVQGQTFFAKLYLRQGSRLIELDARPTDALALAIREDAPFMITDEVLNTYSYPYIFKNGKENDVMLKDFHAFVENLNPEDFF